MRVIINGGREGLRWRSQNKEEETSRSTANNTVECGINNIGWDKDQYSNLASITNSNNEGDYSIGDNEIDNSDNSDNSIGGKNDNREL